ncbi:MAG: uracil-DNA glycosylase [Chloroflexi bacterium]|nr:uracil-DNA glycosylase [Chloroflexota bacterium]
MSTLKELHEEMLGCVLCPLSRSRRVVVPGEGSERARIVFIGEAPGWHEDQQGRPFVGPAGQLLDELMRSIGLRREEVYITNVVKCRPPNNRDPLPLEVQTCTTRWLSLQLQLIQPQITVTLGRFSLNLYFPQVTISKAHGIPRKKDGVVYFPMYHPAAALHQASLRQSLDKDILKLKEVLAEAEPVPEEAPKPQQLSMF